MASGIESNGACASRWRFVLSATLIFASAFCFQGDGGARKSHSGGAVALADGDGHGFEHGQGHDHGPGHGHEAVCFGEPEMPSLLTVERDKVFPERVHVSIHPELDGTARLSIDTDRPVQWVGAVGPATLQLRRGDAARGFALDVPRGEKAGPRRVRVGLTIEDDQGRASLTVHREIELDPPTPKQAAVGSTEMVGVAESGVAVSVRIPADAPVPVQAEVAR
jgi:hypothetical protein